MDMDTPSEEVMVNCKNLAIQTLQLLKAEKVPNHKAITAAAINAAKIEGLIVNLYIGSEYPGTHAPEYILPNALSEASLHLEALKHIAIQANDKKVQKLAENALKELSK